MPFRLVEAEDYIRVPPSDFNKPLEDVALGQLRSKYEGKSFRDLGYVVAVLDAKVNREGVIIFGDGATYHKAIFHILTFMPLDGEVVHGIVESAREVGVMVRIGPVLGFINKIHLMDEPNVLFDASTKSFIGERTKKKLSIGDVVRARITGISYVAQKEGVDLALRITMTMRMPGLGKLEWLKEKKGKKP
ncbi:DNA-directed RNA polymerase [Thermoproteus tenax]|uniref:DNA-directed RNA polymerase subunit Rpo7 n=1 Tax=Thermoproteus tenax (strain ATCC 35583 / DSM 2078 / JCM 9277 / NBRC 100435 / Kra 1) TaxID=768679 RepID=G4RNX1_THETK|nr:DNA-directed RNA polymerase [Thermoproteus tenax]CCC81265.1 DNA-directed RNA polymerase, subunit E' [Thermoproteus tenax Kra 1]